MSFWSIVASNSGAADRILRIDPSAPDQPADIEFIAQQAVTSHGPSTDGGVEPGAATWPRDALGVKSLGDPSRTGSAGVGFKDAPNNGCLLWIDCPQPSIDL